MLIPSLDLSRGHFHRTIPQKQVRQTPTTLSSGPLKRRNTRPSLSGRFQPRSEERGLRLCGLPRDLLGGGEEDLLLSKSRLGCLNVVGADEVAAHGVHI